MIRIGNKVLSDINSRVKRLYAKAECVGIYTPVPSRFPHVCVTEEENVTYVKTKCETGKENHAEITFAVNIYSDSEKQKKEECYSIADIVDDYFQEIGFTRVSFNTAPNIDGSIYRISLRYRGVVSVGKKVGGNTIHMVYQQ